MDHVGHPIQILRSGLLSQIPGIVHGFSTRQGGVSQDPYRSLDVGTRDPSQRHAVEQNRQRLLGQLGKPQARWVSLRQVHGSDVVQVTANAGRSIEADGLWTSDRRAVLAALLADCVPILLADVQGRCVAAVHAGWRGTREKVAAVMVARLAAAGIPPTDLRAAVGPAIGPCCFEIGDDVAGELRETFPRSGEAIRQADDGRTVADLWALNRDVLIGAGLQSSSIDTVQQCTCCTASLFFSHRRDQGVTGRQAGLIALGTPQIS